MSLHGPRRGHGVESKPLFGWEPAQRPMEKHNMRDPNVFDTLILIALPASGKSEVRNPCATETRRLV